MNGISRTFAAFGFRALICPYNCVRISSQGRRRAIRILPRIKTPNRKGVFEILKAYRKNIILFYVLTAAALIAAVFVDLKLDILLNAPENAFAVWFYNTGEIPCRLICPLAGAALFYCCDSKFARFAGICISLGGGAYFGYYFSEHFFTEANQLLFGIVYGVGFSLAVLLSGKLVNIPESIKKPLAALAVAGIAVMAAQLLAVEGMKYLWGRVRFRDLLAAGSYEAFTPWYVINGINGNKSFPSGHTAGAAMSFLAMLLPYISKTAYKHRQLCFYIPFVYTCTVGVTRLIMGAHYLSDIAMGGAVGLLTVIIAIAVLDKKICPSRLKAEQQ